MLQEEYVTPRMSVMSSLFDTSYQELKKEKPQVDAVTVTAEQSTEIYILTGYNVPHNPAPVNNGVS